jgi:ATP-dependent DNA ligase
VARSRTLWHPHASPPALQSPIGRRPRRPPTHFLAGSRPSYQSLLTKRQAGKAGPTKIKYDGYRLHARIDRGSVALLTRTGLDWTEKYPVTADALHSLPVDRAYLDGELIGVRSDGTTSFALIQNASDTGLAASYSSCSTCFTSTAKI